MDVEFEVTGPDQYDAHVAIPTRLVGPEEDDLAPRESEWVRYARNHHPALLRLLAARHHLGESSRLTRSEPLVTFHLAAAIQAVHNAWEILRGTRAGEEFKKWRDQQKKALRDLPGWDAMYALRNRVTHRGVESIRVHMRVAFVEGTDGPYMELGVASIEVDGRTIEKPFDELAAILDHLEKVVQEAMDRGFISEGDPRGRTLHVDFYREDAMGHRTMVDPHDLHHTSRLETIALDQSIRWGRPSSSDSR